jgi:hypothetical protein
MRGSTVIRILAAAIVVGAWVAIYAALHGGLGPRINSEPHEATGRLMAQQALANLKPGGQITVFARATAAFKNPATDIQLASFRKVVGQAHATIRAVHALPVDPLRPLEVPSSDFYEVIKNTPKGSVIVSFMGPPVLTPSQRTRLGEIQPAIVAFCSGNLPAIVDLPSLFQQGLLHAAIIEQRESLSASSPAGNLDCAQPTYLAVTAANLAQLAAQTDK